MYSYVYIYIYIYIYIYQKSKQSIHINECIVELVGEKQHACPNPGANHGRFCLYRALQILAFQIELCEKFFGQGLVWLLISVVFFPY